LWRGKNVVLLRWSFGRAVADPSSIWQQLGCTTAVAAAVAAPRQSLDLKLSLAAASAAFLQADQLHHDARPQQRKEADGCE
jgi:hypothetical protein